jgi:hypothetical protein
VGLANLGSESETCVGSRVHLVGVSISFEKNFYRLPFTPPSLVRRIGPSTLFHGFDTLGSHLREEGSLGYDSGFVRLRVQTKLDTYFNRQHGGSGG